jgi:elongator complex protein 5
MLIKATGPSRLIVHGLQTCKLAPLLIQPAFSPSLICLLSRPSVLITHLAREYLTPPPPVSSDAKFWGVFLPVSERDHECERLVFGSDGEGSGSTTEFVVEVLVRGLHGSGKKRGVERSLEGWCSSEGGVCELTKLESLKTLWRKSEAVADSEVCYHLDGGLSSYSPNASLASGYSRGCSRCIFQPDPHSIATSISGSGSPSI